jgi:hypothetical protein
MPATWASSGAAPGETHNPALLLLLPLPLPPKHCLLPTVYIMIFISHLMFLLPPPCVQ